VTDRIVAEGTPEEIAEVANSFTGQYLRRKLTVGAVREPPLGR